MMKTIQIIRLLKYVRFRPRPLPASSFGFPSEHNCQKLVTFHGYVDEDTDGFAYLYIILTQTTKWES